MSLARRHRDRVLAAKTVAFAPDGGASPAPAAALSTAAGVNSARPVDRAIAEITLRYTHDLRRLKEIKAVSLKIAAKREMIPEYRDWIIGLVEADKGVGTGLAAEIPPTVMVWLIDVGAYADALRLGDFLLRHKVEMPARYNRDVATVLVEEIAEAALKAIAANESFELALLEQVELMTCFIDMHDEVRAKLAKAIGMERLDRLENGEASPDQLGDIDAVLASLRNAQNLHARIGVKDKIKRAEKLRAANIAAFPPAQEQCGAAA